MESDLERVRAIAADLNDTIEAFRERYGFGRGIAAPQIGEPLRVVRLNLDPQRVMINPELTDLADEMDEMWDNCMSFPDLMVRLLRHRNCQVHYRDLDWRACDWNVPDDLAELIQHECDHLEGILAVQRAIDLKSFALRDERDRQNRKPSTFL